MADEGLTTAAIAASLGISLPSVSKWRNRVAGQGMAGLREVQRSGRVLGRCTDRRTQADLVAFMEEVARVYTRGTVHVIWDTLNTHRAQAVWDDFNNRHGQRFVFHFTPLHASWVNQIELLFGIDSCRVLRHASHSCTEHLRQRTETFIAQRNVSPKPFKWTFAGFELQTGEPKKFARHAHTPRPSKRS